MPVSAGRWPFLRTKTATRLEFLAHENEQSQAPCRLPQCGGWAVRPRKRGRNAWFCGRSCADAFRTQRRALDAALHEMLERFTSETLTVRERNQLRSDLEWLTEVRQAYVSPGSWRAHDPDADPSASADSDEVVTQLLTGRPHHRDPCPSCGGTGDLFSRRRDVSSLPALERRRLVRDKLVSMARLFEELLRLEPQVETAYAVDHWRQRAEEAATEFQGELEGNGRQDR